MDPIICCLLGVCCPPVQRQERVQAYLIGHGIQADAADVAAKDLIDKFDASSLGKMLHDVAEHARKHHA